MVDLFTYTITIRLWTRGSICHLLELYPWGKGFAIFPWVLRLCGSRHGSAYVYSIHTSIGTSLTQGFLCSQHQEARKEAVTPGCPALERPILI